METTPASIYPISNVPNIDPIFCSRNMSEIKEQQSVMDLDTLGSNPKMMREANERWTDNDRRILIQIITKKNDGKYNKILSGKASTVTMMSQTWKNICDDFAAATNRDNVNLQKLRSLWKKIKVTLTLLYKLVSNEALRQ